MLPDYWLERPPLSPSRSTQAAVEEFLSLGRPGGSDGLPHVDSIVHAGGITPWHFLCAVAESFEPRRPIDFAPFGHQKAVFATTDPIWAMYYAIVDRDRHRLTLNNGCILVMDAEARRELPYYYFSITDGALPEQPWRTGYIYFLPAETFVPQPAATYAGRAARVPQLASPVAVTPFARLRVGPGDFPFLARIRGHDDERLAEYAQAVMTAAPWPG